MDYFENIRVMGKVVEEMMRPYEVLAKQMEDVEKSISDAFKLPEIDFSKFEIDRELIKKRIEKNTSLGWALNDYVNMDTYLEHSLEDKTNLEIDEYFYEYYTSDNEEVFKHVFEYILENANIIHQSLLYDAYHAYKDGHIKTIIPTMLLAIEGELIQLIDKPEKKGYWLAIEIERKYKSLKEGDLAKLVLFSICSYLQKTLYTRGDFSNSAKFTNNRHQILHGRSDSSLWTKVDLVKYTSFLCSIISVKEILKDE
ncbi:hypothetical protein GCM10008931_43450 [Oceanobacillus oncorhynchi subsp. oncorhynchi]|uniref:hypothetical protein n=1 Tax=Oceanobacillus oncorhynchi TaxID=545501 RepID=UPI0031E18F00